MQLHILYTHLSHCVVSVESNGCLHVLGSEGFCICVCVCVCVCMYVCVCVCVSFAFVSALHAHMKCGYV